MCILERPCSPQTGEWIKSGDKLVTVRPFGGCFPLPPALGIRVLTSAVLLNRYKSSKLSKKEGIKVFSKEASF